MKKYWFRAKSYGWGWTPSTWQGWLVIGIYLLAMILFPLFIQNNSQAKSLFIIPTIILTTLLLVICYKKGEKPSWRWGPSTKKK